MTSPEAALGWNKNDDPQSALVQAARGPFEVEVADGVTVRVVSRDDVAALKRVLADVRVQPEATWVVHEPAPATEPAQTTETEDNDTSKPARRGRPPKAAATESASSETASNSSP